VSVGQGKKRRTVVYFAPERYRNEYAFFIIAAVRFGSLLVIFIKNYLWYG